MYNSVDRCEKGIELERKGGLSRFAKKMLCVSSELEDHRKDACPQRIAEKKESNMQDGQRKTYSSVVIGFGAFN